MIGPLAAVYGWFVEPIGWSLALIVWGYALVWFLINNMVKRLTLGVLQHAGPSKLGDQVSETAA